MSKAFEENARWIAVPGLFAVLLLTAISLSEWYAVGVEADPAVIERYHFGSEAMLGHGGEAYRSPEAYARNALTRGLVTIGIASVFIVAMVRKSGLTVIAGYILIVAAIVIGHLS